MCDANQNFELFHTQAIILNPSTSLFDTFHAKRKNAGTPERRNAGTPERRNAGTPEY